MNLDGFQKRLDKAAVVAAEQTGDSYMDRLDRSIHAARFLAFHDLLVRIESVVDESDDGEWLVELSGILPREGPPPEGLARGLGTWITWLSHGICRLPESASAALLLDLAKVYRDNPKSEPSTICEACYLAQPSGWGKPCLHCGAKCRWPYEVGLGHQRTPEEVDEILAAYDRLCEEIDEAEEAENDKPTEN